MSHKKPAFYACAKCHVIIEEICGDRGGFSCCGAPMEELHANTSDGAQEKHLPVIEQNGNTVTVKVGSVFHPMTEEHSIEWVYLQTEKGCQRVCLASDQAPEAVFMLADNDKPVAAYAYCNLHGFWKTEF
ncbi:desulfoferrodoxin family protein [Luxibacter massiliensis]|uniref:desulfoferrodoxin family protein n=1 Tax=Luxibacter massiliensis TaxID=2219695 RepID=UPI000F04625D|nr:desulfoferrodoxin family protein [Luxibacter massiliensis]